MKFYIKDNSIGADSAPELFKNEKSFLESLKYNYEVAKEYGDGPDSLEDLIASVKRGEEVEVNDFLYYSDKCDLEIFLDAIKNNRIRNLARLYASAPEELTPKEMKQLVNSGVDLEHLDNLVMKGEY